jgi:uncharacterized membrane protein
MLTINVLTLIIGVIGIVIIAWGIVVVALEFCYSGYLAILHKESKIDKFFLRRQLGSYILLGLEFMIAADIIRTFITPSKEDLIILGAIVAIRTVISYFLNLELQSAK